MHHKLLSDGCHCTSDNNNNNTLFCTPLNETTK